MEDCAIVAEDVESIICECLGFINAAPLDPEVANFVWDGLREYLQSRYESTKEILYLQRAIEIARMATKITTPFDEKWLIRLQALGSLLADRFKHTRTLKDLEEAICAVQEFINAAWPDYPGLTNDRYHLGLMLGLKFSMAKDMADLDKAICIIQDIINTGPPNDFDKKQYLDLFLALMDTKCNCVREIEGIEDAICLGQRFVDESLPSHPERVIFLICLANLYHVQHDSFLQRQSSFHDQYDFAQQIRDTIDQAVSLAQEANDTVSLMNPVLVKSQCMLHLDKRYQSFRERGDLEEVIWMSLEAVENCPLDDKRWLCLLLNLVNGLRMRYDSTKALEDIDDTVIMAQETISILPTEHPGRNMMLCELGTCLLSRNFHAGMPADLDESIQVLQDPRYAAALDPEIQRERLRHLARSFSTRYLRAGLQSDIEESICLILENIESTPLDHPARVNLLLDLGISLGYRFVRTNRLTDVDEAIEIFRYSLEAIPPNRPGLRISHLTHLSYSLHNRYAETGAMSDLNECIDLDRHILEFAYQDDADRSKLLSSLAGGLQSKYERTKEIGDLNESIALFREALELPPLDSFQRIRQLHDFSLALSGKFKVSEDMADLEEAILMSQEAVNILDPIDHQTRAIVFLAHASHLYQKFEQTGAKTHLNEAIDGTELALNEPQEGNHERAEQLLSLGYLLKERFLFVKMLIDILISGGPNEPSTDPVAKHLKDLEIWTAIELYGIKVQSISDVVEFLHNTEHYCIEAMSDLQRSREYFVEVLNLETAKVKARLKAGKSLMNITSFANRPDSYDHAKYTVNLIPLLASPSLPNSDKQSLWSEAVGLSSLAAAVAINNLPPERGPLAAIECLETGRGLIAGSIFEQYDIISLQKQHPQLAGRFLALQNQRADPASQKILSTINGTASTIKTENNGYNKPEQELNELLEVIRSQSNFQHFRLPPSEHDMLQAACDGPIVVLNVGLNRGDALLIEQSGLRVLELPRLALKNRGFHLIAKHSCNVESLDTLAWLWDDIVCPVLNALGFTEPPAEESWPHVWWIPTGFLARFPLHAAGRHLERNGETAIDRVVSSYATSVKALIHSRRRGEPIAEEPLNVVAVAMEETGEQATLENAGYEVDAIVDILRSKTMNCHRPDPIKDEVLKNVKSCQIFHFAGHGETHSYDPLQSKLLLKDWRQNPLTAASLLETDFGSNPPFLAYLSACGTGQIRDMSSGDESIHLANAFQLAGFRHVIGTLWSVKDNVCVEIAELTYRYLCRSGKIRDDMVSRGLHNAVREVRDRWVNMANEYAENELDEDMEYESRGSDESRAARHAKLIDESEDVARPLWIPYVHFGV